MGFSFSFSSAQVGPRALFMQSKYSYYCRAITIDPYFTTDAYFSRINNVELTFYNLIEYPLS